LSRFKYLCQVEKTFVCILVITAIQTSMEMNWNIIEKMLINIGKFWRIYSSQCQVFRRKMLAETKCDKVSNQKNIRIHLLTWSPINKAITLATEHKYPQI
jgi:hypothetical protein